MGRRQEPCGEPCGPARAAGERPAKTRAAAERPEKTRAAGERPAKTRAAAERPEKTRAAGERAEKTRATGERAMARTAKADFAEVVLVCRKCAKRQGVDRKRLGRALKRAAGRPEDDARQKARKVKVVETGCLGPCPKRMLTVATTASLARGRVVLLEPALDALSPQALTLGMPGLESPAAPVVPDADV